MFSATTLGCPNQKLWQTIGSNVMDTFLWISFIKNVILGNVIAGQILKVDNAKETRQPFPPEIEDPVFTPLPSILPEQTVRAGVYLGIPSKSNLFTNMTLDVQVSVKQNESQREKANLKIFH